MVYDSPRQHPRITEEEKNYIVKSLAASSVEHDETIGKKSKKVPWRAILTSGPFWVTILAHWGGVWGFLTFMTQAPSYFNYVQGWNINAVRFVLVYSFIGFELFRRDLPIFYKFSVDTDV